ncbi:FixH family protein [Umezawaea endophytica]|uniref:FixH family protein n=1 Tax=Umezawaea endophytica TaxID=1654476 RepID=A0A9X3A1E2_9PSEU|nr:FixH family protein [Umezawaea endophytica]MCS7477913.1 FixH family protein [Umezawaea endophytica]
MTKRGRVVLATAVVVAVIGGALAMTWAGTTKGQAVLEGGTSRHTVRVVVEPAAVGTTVVRIEVGAASGVVGVRLEPAMAHMGHALAPLAAALEGPGRYRVDTTFDMPGPWELTVAVEDGLGTQRVALPLVITG